MNDYKEELHKISTNLATVRERFNGWIDENFEVRRCQKEKFKALMKKCEDESLEMKQSIQCHNEELEKIVKDNEMDRKKLISLEDEQKVIKANIQDILFEKEDKQQQLEEMTENLGKEKEIFEAQKKLLDQRQQELKKAASLYSDHLGLEFKKIDGEKMQTVMTLLDPKDHQRAFFFNFRITDDTVYEVLECHPPLENLERLVATLNKTNNFSAFIVSMRKSFKDLCKE